MMNVNSDRTIVVITEERRQAIETAIEDSEMSLSKIAESIGLSKSNLSRVKLGKIKSMDEPLYMMLETNYLWPYLDNEYRHVKKPENMVDKIKASMKKFSRIEYNILLDKFNKLSERINEDADKLEYAFEELKNSKKENTTLRKRLYKFRKMVNKEVPKK